MRSGWWRVASGLPRRSRATQRGRAVKRTVACSSGCSSADPQDRWSTSRRRSSDPWRGAARLSLRPLGRPCLPWKPRPERDEGEVKMLRLRSRNEDRFLSASLAAGLLRLGTAALADRRSADDLSIATVSTRADLVSGGDVLVRIDVPRSVALSDLEVRMNGATVTGAFLPDSTGDALVGLVSGLNDGDN